MMSKHVSKRSYGTLGRKIDLRGIYPAIPTPFSNDEKQTLALDKLKYNLKKWETIPFKGYCVGGTYGELLFLTPDERLEMIRTVKKSVSSDKFIIAGATAQSTGETVKLCIDASEEGADAVMVMVPFYFKSKMTDELIKEHFMEIAENSPIPVILYNNTNVTGIDMPIDVIENLASHRNIIGIKDGDIGKLAGILERTKDQDFIVLPSSAVHLLPAMLIGCQGSINGLSVVLGDAVCQLYKLGAEKKWEEALKIHRKIILPDLVILRELGPAGLKASMDLLGYYGGSPRKPLKSVDDQTKKRIIKALGISGDQF